MKPANALLSLILGLLAVSEPLLVFAQEYVPPKRGTPARREGAGTRGTCMQGVKPLMPLVPEDGFSATTSTNPIFFWYIPETIARTGEFVLLDSTDQELYRTRVQLAEVPGVISYRLPADVASPLLATGKEFHWQFSVICDPAEPSKNPFVEGVIQYVEPDNQLLSQLKTAVATDRANVFAAAGLWQDAITVLAQQRCDFPQDSTVMGRWKKLLKSANLEGYTGEPLSSTCLSISSQPVPLQK